MFKDRVFLKASFNSWTPKEVYEIGNINQNGTLTDFIHVETNYISCYLFINSSLNTASLFGVCVCVCTDVWVTLQELEYAYRFVHSSAWRHSYLCLCVFVCNTVLHRWFQIQPQVHIQIEAKRRPPLGTAIWARPRAGILWSGGCLSCCGGWRFHDSITGWLVCDWEVE